MVFKSEKELERTESFNAVFSSGVKPILRDVKKKKPRVFKHSQDQIVKKR